jgi:hypothetical protein
MMPKRLLSLAASSAATLSLVAAGVASVATPVSAAGGTGNVVCSKQGINVIACNGLINGNNINITISNLLNNNNINLSVLSNDLDNVLNHDKVILPIQIQVDKVAIDVVSVLVKNLDVLVCQVKVVELGIVNNNLALCN